MKERWQSDYTSMYKNFIRVFETHLSPIKWFQLTGIIVQQSYAPTADKKFDGEIE